MAQILKPAVEPPLDSARAQMRADLAACHRLAALYGMTDLIYTHISARLPGADDQFLINPFGLLFEEIRADNLVTVGPDGELLDDPSGLGINRAGFVIHSAVHQARPDAVCVMHTHTLAGVAVSSLRDGLLPYTQHAARFHNRIGYHAYEGVAVDLDERNRLVRDLGPHKALMLRNHGLLTCGATVGEAFELMFFLEFACRAQLQIQATGQAVAVPALDAIERAAATFDRAASRSGPRLWQALLRRLDHIDPSYHSMPRGL
ncbi:class II aldolase/adducin family protein [Achromobacter seleniivolatilans]|uniref:Class II aldolase/adducin family protein n=1 Tax=Achromobacter seleniivolatilans TaxID=3047478 RepID=A0ABY9M5A9_9BURK|nr:class II aldolase/adducin family protein [Achromobacter sp. R39]WMD22176.1 class II aldolase/adducin family protein [Achromobacter sp. R39]